MAFPDRQWARSWRKFVQDSFWLDSLQIGQLLLLVLALITLLFLLMFSFCCCFPRNKRRRPPQKRGSNQQLLANNWHRTPQTASFRTSNEERRRLLPPSYAATNLQNCRSSSLQQPNEKEQMLADGQIVVENERIEDAEQKNTMPPIVTNCSTSPALANHHFVKHGQTPSGTPFSVSFRKPPPPHLVEQSPPPPRRLAPPGGKTQVLPLTNSNRKRVPALMLLMADQETQKPKTPSSVRSAGTPESRATTTAAKSCETIPEDPEVDISASEELMSIDRTLISASTVTAQPQTICQFQPRSSFRLASPFPQPPPKFEILPPSYSPPEPPVESICRIAQNNNAAADGSTTRSNLSSPDQSSYGGQTPLNTTTGSSESVIHQGDDGKIRISELEYSDIGRSGIGGGTVAEMEALDGCWPTVASTVESQIQPSLPSILANLPANRVPRSISQQLELMEEMAAAKNRGS